MFFNRFDFKKRSFAFDAVIIEAKFTRDAIFDNTKLLLQNKTFICLQNLFWKSGYYKMFLSSEIEDTLIILTKKRNYFYEIAKKLKIYLRFLQSLCIYYSKSFWLKLYNIYFGKVLIFEKLHSFRFNLSFKMLTSLFW